jgi:hypothetical protein
LIRRPETVVVSGFSRTCERASSPDMRRRKRISTDDHSSVARLSIQAPNSGHVMCTHPFMLCGRSPARHIGDRGKGRIDMHNDPLVPDNRHIPIVTRENLPSSNATVLSTRDHQIIREWAERNSAEPATGEATPSGAATTMKVEDQGTGLRFNFPGMSRFRAISWAEWFDHFNRFDLTFVFDNPQPNEPPSARYRIVSTSEVANR